MFVLSRYFLIQIVFNDLFVQWEKINHFKPTIALLVNYNISFNLVGFPVRYKMIETFVQFFDSLAVCLQRRKDINQLGGD